MQKWKTSYSCLKPLSVISGWLILIRNCQAETLGDVGALFAERVIIRLIYKVNRSITPTTYDSTYSPPKYLRLHILSYRLLPLLVTLRVLLLYFYTYY